MSMTAFLEITREGETFTVEVSGTYHGAIRGYRDRYGAPEEPDEPAYVDDICAKTLVDVVTDDGKLLFTAGAIFELDDAEDAAASEALAQRREDMIADECEGQSEGDDFGPI